MASIDNPALCGSVIWVLRRKDKDIILLAEIKFCRPAKVCTKTIK
jgi:hypothetical protein